MGHDQVWKNVQSMYLTQKRQGTSDKRKSCCNEKFLLPIPPQGDYPMCDQNGKVHMKCVACPIV